MIYLCALLGIMLSTVPADMNAYNRCNVWYSHRKVLFTHICRKNVSSSSLRKEKHTAIHAIKAYTWLFFIK